ARRFARSSPVLDGRPGVVPALLFLLRAEDGIRGRSVTGVQTCALPISPAMTTSMSLQAIASGDMDVVIAGGVESMTRAPMFANKIGRASCREKSVELGAGRARGRKRARRCHPAKRGGEREGEQQDRRAA